MTRSFTNCVFRFAPSSNGYLHLGHAYSALLNFAMARATGGRFLLRIEDIDIDRCRSNSNRRFTRISAGSVSRGKRRFAVNPSIFRITHWPLRNFRSRA